MQITEPMPYAMASLACLVSDILRMSATFKPAKRKGNPMGKVSVSANIVAKSGAASGGKPLTLDQALGLAEAELATLRAWMSIDADTPYRREAAARLRWLANALEIGL